VRVFPATFAAPITISQRLKSRGSCLGCWKKEYCILLGCQLKTIGAWLLNIIKAKAPIVYIIGRLYSVRVKVQPERTNAGCKDVFQNIKFYKNC